MMNDATATALFCLVTAITAPVCPTFGPQPRATASGHSLRPQPRATASSHSLGPQHLKPCCIFTFRIRLQTLQLLVSIQNDFIYVCVWWWWWGVTLVSLVYRLIALNQPRRHLGSMPAPCCQYLGRAEQHTSAKISQARRCCPSTDLSGLTSKTRGPRVNPLSKSHWCMRDEGA